MVGPITVVGLGPAGPELITPDTQAAIDGHSRRFLRTEQHPGASVVRATATFDAIYESAATFDEVYRTIVAELVELAQVGPLLYAVPGSPLVLERTVAELRALHRDEIVEVDLRPAMSFLDVVWARLAIDPVEEAVRLIDGHQFAEAAAGQTGPLLVAHTHARHILSDIKLAVQEPPTAKVVVLQRLGSGDELITEVAWEDLDRIVDADHLTSIYIPALAEPVGAAFVRLDELVRTLRSDCPWDREQTHDSLRVHLLEETHEAIEALDGLDLEAGTGDDHLAEELGDVLYQIFFHARLAAERGAFAISDVADGLHDKLVSRHPHVFGEVEAADTDTVLANWETIKQAEKKRNSVLDGIAPSLPALMLAQKLQKRAVSLGLPPDPALAEIVAALPHEPTEADLGLLVLAVVAIARRANVDLETATREAARAFEAKARQAEAQAKASSESDSAG